MHSFAFSNHFEYLSQKIQITGAACTVLVVIGTYSKCKFVVLTHSSGLILLVLFVPKTSFKAIQIASTYVYYEDYFSHGAGTYSNFYLTE